MKRDDQKTKAELIAELEKLRANARTSDCCRFRQIVDELPQCIYELNAEGSLTYANVLARKTFGVTQQDIDDGFHVLDAIHPDSHADVLENIDRVLRGTSDAGTEYLGRAQDGTTFPVKVYSQRALESGRVVGLRGVLIDISDIKEVEAALQQSEQFYRTLFENTGTAMCIIDINSIITSCNSQFAQLAECDIEDLIGIRRWTDFVAPADLERMTGYYDERFKKRHAAPDNYQFIFQSHKGTQKHIRVFVRIIPGSDNRICSLIDVTDQVKTLEALRTSEERYQLVVKGANDGVWDWDLTTNEVWYSVRYKEILGYTDEEFPNHVESWQKAVHPEDLEHTIAANTECIEDRVDQFEVEYRMLHKDGSVRWIHGRGASTRDADGTVHRLAGTHTDITARKFNERTTNALYAISSAISTTRDLKELYETIHNIIDQATHAKNFFIAFWDREKDQLHFPYFVDELDEYYTLENVSDPEINSLTIHIFRTGDPMLMSNANPEDIAHMESVGIIGTPPAHWLGVPLKLNENVVGAMVVQDYHNPNVYSDADVAFMTAVSEQVAMVIERKTNEEELTRLNEKLENLVDMRTSQLLVKATELEEANQRLLELDEIKSSLVSSVSHELRTPLTSIRGFAKLCMRDFKNHFSALSDSPKHIKKANRILENLNIIDTEGDRLTRLINDFLDINRIESGKASWHDAFIDPCDIVRKGVSAASGSFAARSKVTIDVDMPESCQLIHADPDKIQQVIINLLNNAYKFTKEGSVTVSLVQETGTVTVAICDTGAGIPQAEAPHLFEKFHKSASGDTVTSKEKGTGLGLAICKEIVEHYGGSIWVDSTPGMGSCFSFSLPTI